MAETKSSKGVRHLVSVPTYGDKARTILATHQGMITLGTPLPDGGGWLYAIITSDGREAVATAERRYEAIYDACEQLGVDPVRIMGRSLTDRAEARQKAVA
jgi:hypothetical protein